MRLNASPMDVRNALSEGVDTEGGYLVPHEFERTLIQSLQDQNIMRSLAKVIQTTSGDRKIPVVFTHGTAGWLDEGKSYTESDEVFTQVTLSAIKLGTFLKISEELLNDAAFNVEQYLAVEFARRIGAAEEEVFLVGDGKGKPTGIFAATGGGEKAVTTGKATDITADELIDLHHGLRARYRKNAVWLMNDSTVKTIRKLKDGNGQYLWQPALTAGTWRRFVSTRGTLGWPFWRNTAETQRGRPVRGTARGTCSAVERGSVCARSARAASSRAAVTFLRSAGYANLRTPESSCPSNRPPCSASHYAPPGVMSPSGSTGGRLLPMSEQLLDSTTVAPFHRSVLRDPRSTAHRM